MNNYQTAQMRNQAIMEGKPIKKGVRITILSILKLLDDTSFDD